MISEQRRTGHTDTGPHTHRCDRCRFDVNDPRGHYYAPLHGASGFYCHPCFEIVSASP